MLRPSRSRTVGCTHSTIFGTASTTLLVMEQEHPLQRFDSYVAS